MVAHSPIYWRAFIRDYGLNEMVEHSETLYAGAHLQDVGNLYLSNLGATIAALRLLSGLDDGA
jgi:hypothetical protein